MIGPLGRSGPAATLRQHCPQMTRRRCNSLRTFPAHINSRSLTDFKDRSKTDFKKLSAEERTEELLGLISHLVPLSTQLADVVNALSARFHGMEDRKDIQHVL